MYVDKKRGSGPVIFLAALVLTAAVLLWQGVFSGSGRDMDQEGMAAVKAAVERSAMQCYVVEGVYPPSLEYLEENYGLQINHEEFYVIYSAFASNVPPDVRVVVREK